MIYFFEVVSDRFQWVVYVPLFGDPSAETQKIELEGGWLPSMPLLRSDGTEQHVGVYVPNDLPRQGAAMLLAERAMEFLLFHEVGHIVCGHLDMARGHRCCQPRFQMAENGERKIIATRICECDADAYAGHVSSTVTLMQSMDEKLYHSLNCPSWTLDEFGMVTYATAIAGLFRILDNNERADPTSEREDHPHPAVRCCFVLSAALTRAVMADKLTSARAMELSFIAIRNFEDAWEELQLPGQRKFSPETFGDRMAQGMWKLFRDYQAHSEELSKYARLPRNWCDWEPLPVA